MKKFLVAIALMTLPMTATTMLLTAPTFAAVKTSKLGDISAMRKIVADTLVLVNAGNVKGAVKRITEFETAWDENANKLKKRDSKTWTKLDEAADVALSTVRYPSATPAEMKKDLAALIAMMDNPNS